MKKQMSRLVSAVLDVVYPRTCPVCRDVVTPKGEMICPGCRERLGYVTEPTCMRCGKTIASEQDEYCVSCREKKISFERGFAVFVYDDVMQQAIADFKYRNKKELGDFFACEMAKVYRKQMQCLGIEALVPVPIHEARRRYRGYNQAEVLCEKLSPLIGVPVLKDRLVRDRKTIPQKELDAAERLKNLEQAVSLRPDAKRLPRTVLLVDDIYTTGSTAEACSRILLRGGVKVVYNFSLSIGTER